MMCHSIGRPPISTIGLGRTVVSSESRVPSPPAKMTTFTNPPKVSASAGERPLPISTTQSQIATTRVLQLGYGHPFEHASNVLRTTTTWKVLESATTSFPATRQVARHYLVRHAASASTPGDQRKR